MVQGELFREEKSQFGSSPFETSHRKAFFSRYRIAVTLDKLLLGSIALVVAFALVYSFGVEQGKRSIEKQIQTFLPPHSEAVSTSVGTSSLGETLGETLLLVGEESERATFPLEPEKPSEVIQETKPSLPTVDLSRSGKFTVQLVTYNSEKQALQEISRLNAKGHTGFVIPSGPYFQVCANYFENQSKAQNLLKQFRGRYPDAYIRPVVR